MIGDVEDSIVDRDFISSGRCDVVIGHSVMRGELLAESSSFGCQGQAWISPAWRLFFPPDDKFHACASNVNNLRKDSGGSRAVLNTM